MVQTLFARIKEMSQYKPGDRKIVWEDPSPGRWTKVYGLLKPGDNAVFVGTGQMILIGQVAVVDDKRGIVECREIETFPARPDDMLRIHALYPEKLSRMKGFFEPFLAPFELDIDAVRRALAAHDYVLFHVFADSQRFQQAQADLHDRDRIVTLDAAGRFEEVLVLRRRTVSDADAMTLTSTHELDALEKSEPFLAKGLTPEELCEQLAASKGDAHERSTLLALARRMQRELALDGLFTFRSFNGYHNTLFNKRALGSAGSRPAAATDDKDDDSREQLYAPPLNQILFGPPGTGKTYATIEKALHILGVSTTGLDRDDIKQQFDRFVKDGRIVFCTFHQSLSYEDFIEGIKPVAPAEAGGSVGYRVEPGIFQRLCIDARKALSSALTATDDATEGVPRFVLIIDEINRANVSQVFGELITLLEDDKRLGHEEQLTVTLPYSKESFGVPPNLYLIGTMNTADRSVEALDTALRRRFVFESIPPDPDALDVHLPEPLCGVRLSALMNTINARLELLLGADHLIGHAYFMKVVDETSLRSCLCEKIVPLLSEYFYGDIGKIGLVLGPGFIRPKVASTRSKVGFAKFDYDIGELDQRTLYEIVARKDIDIGMAIAALMEGVDPDAGAV